VAAAATYKGGNNQLFGENYGEMATLVNAGETADSINEKGDLLSAGSGIDQLYGSNRNDAMFGENILAADNYATSPERRLAL